MECPKCDKVLERKIVKGEVIYPCDDCGIIVQSYEEMKNYKPVINEVIDVRFRDSDTNELIGHVITSAIPETGNLVSINSKLYKVIHKVYDYYYDELKI